MAQGIVTYDQAPGTRSRIWESMVAPGRAAAYSTNFCGIDDKGDFTSTGTASFGALTNAGGATGEVTQNATASKNVNNEINLSGTLGSGRAFVEVKIKSAAASAGAVFVGFAQNTAANKVLTTAGAVPTASDGEDKIGLYCVASSTDIDYYAAKDGTENVNEVDSTIDMADDTYVTLGVEIVGTEIRFFINGELKKTYSESLAYVAAETFKPVFSLAGNAVCTIDYFVAGFDA